MFRDRILVVPSGWEKGMTANGYIFFGDDKNNLKSGYRVH